jgi:osmotically-inducible protein OsmY
LGIPRDHVEVGRGQTAELDAESLGVETNNGKVALHGRLRSWAEREEAERLAWAGPGVTEFENLSAIAPERRGATSEFI